MNDQIHIHLALKQIHDVINVKSYKIKLDVVFLFDHHHLF